MSSHSASSQGPSAEIASPSASVKSQAHDELSQQQPNALRPQAPNTTAESSATLSSASAPLMERGSTSISLPITENYIVHRTYTEDQSDEDDGTDDDDDSDSENQDEFDEEESGIYSNSNLEQFSQDPVSRITTNDSTNILSKLVQSPASQLNLDASNSNTGAAANDSDNDNDNQDGNHSDEESESDSGYINYKHVDNDSDFQNNSPAPEQPSVSESSASKNQSSPENHQPLQDFATPYSLNYKPTSQAQSTRAFSVSHIPPPTSSFATRTIKRSNSTIIGPSTRGSTSQDLKLQSSPTTALSFATGFGTGFTEMPLYDYRNDYNYEDSDYLTHASRQRLQEESSSGVDETRGVATADADTVSLFDKAKRNIIDGFGSFKKKKSSKVATGNGHDSSSSSSGSTGADRRQSVVASPYSSPAFNEASSSSDNLGADSCRINSPEPTLSIDHNSDVATLLSEVLDGDVDTQSINANIGTAAAIDRDAEHLVESSSLAATNSPDWTNHSDAGLEYPHSITSSFNESSDDGGSDGDHDGEEEENEEDEEAKKDQKELEKFLARKKQYFILSTAGKPIYSMYGSDELVTGYMGVFQAIVSYFEEDTSPLLNPGDVSFHGTAKSSAPNPKEGLQMLRAGDAIFVFALEDPLILIAIDKLGQTELQLRAQLDLLYAQILSTLTKSQLSRVFKNRANFDLRPMLSGTEVFLNALTKEMSFGSPGILLGALECLRLRKSMRTKMHSILLERRTKSLLYGIIVADSRLVAVIRPRKHSLHPPDLHLVFSMLFNTQSFSKGDGEHWVPICLPKFNATGFLYAYIHFFAPPQVALVLISADKNAFFELQTAKNNIVSDLNSNGLITPILNSLKRGRYRSIEILGTPHLSYSNQSRPQPPPQSPRLGNGTSSAVAQLSSTISSWIPASSLAPFTIRHFLYKSKPNVQFVMPSFDPHYIDNRARHKLMILYHQLHGALHSASRVGAGGATGNNLRVYHVSRGNSGTKGSALAWLTPTFELYCVTGSAHEGVNTSSSAAGEESATLIPINVNNKDAMLRAVKTIVNWIKSHEERLFIFGGAVF